MHKVVRPVIIAATLSLCLSRAGIAANEGPKTVKSLSSTSVTPTIGAFIFWGSTNLEPAPVYGVKVSRDSLGVDIADSFGVEGTFNYFATKATNGKQEDATGYVFRVDGIYDIPLMKKKYQPFFAVGLGDILIDRGTSSQNSFLINYGLGIKYRLEEWLTLRADLRHLLVYKNVNTSDVVEMSAGLTYHFGKDHTKKAPAPQPVAPVPAISGPEPEAKPVAPIDVSLLGKLGIGGPAVVGISLLPDGYQTAPPPPPPPFANIPAPVAPPQAAPPAEVAAQAPAPPPPAPEAPQAPAPPAPGPELTPVQPAPPQAQPEEPKQVIEAKPQPAPEQPALPKIIYQVTVEFDFDSSVVRPMYFKELKTLAGKIEEVPGTSVSIEGHTDIIGRAGYNDRLSARRAKAVKEYLIKLGVPAKKISTKGYGFYKPAAENATETGRQKNRRASALAIVIHATAAPAQDKAASAASGAPQRGEKPATKRNVRSKTNNKTTVRRPK